MVAIDHEGAVDRLQLGQVFLRHAPADAVVVEATLGELCRGPSLGKVVDLLDLVKSEGVLDQGLD